MASASGGWFRTMFRGLTRSGGRALPLPVGVCVVGVSLMTSFRLQGAPVTVWCEPDTTVDRAGSGSSATGKAPSKPPSAAPKSLTGHRRFDVAVVGGGIVGLATARELQMRHPGLRLVVVEKESELATHQTGHNSGVIHAGIYYPPGSLKAKLCLEGNKLTYDYCDEKGIPYKRVGKCVVAVEEEELPRLEALFERAKQNGVPGVRLLNAQELQEMEPNCRGLAAIHCPTTGIVDWAQVARSFGDDFVQLGGTVYLNHEVVGFSSKHSHRSKDYSRGVAVIVKDQDPLICDHVITCGGLYADRLAKLSGCPSDPQIVPFRGEYLVLSPEKAKLVNGNIYPVPNPLVPFLGVHFTPRMDGSVWLGPNAVLAFAREGYSYRDFSFDELVEALRFAGLRKLVRNYFSFGVQEFYRSIWISAQVKQLQRYVPDLTIDDVTRGPAGVRAQAMDCEGKLVGDFVFGSGKGSAQGRLLHVRNAPSPAATSSMAIAKLIADRAEEDFGLSSQAARKP